MSIGLQDHDNYFRVASTTVGSPQDGDISVSEQAVNVQTLNTDLLTVSNDNPIERDNDVGCQPVPLAATQEIAVSLSEAQAPSTSTAGDSEEIDVAKTLDSPLCRPVLDSYPWRYYGDAGERKRRFTIQHYSSFPWLEYSIKRDSAYCFPCRFFSKDVNPFSNNTGFSDWNHMTGDGYGITAHNASKSHRWALVTWEEYKNRAADRSSVLDLLEKSHEEMKQNNIMYVKTLIDIILFCGRQELALRGDDETVGSLNRGNFLELV